MNKIIRFIGIVALLLFCSVKIAAQDSTQYILTGGIVSIEKNGQIKIGLKFEWIFNLKRKILTELKSPGNQPKSKMGKIVLDLAVTLDGYISGPNGEIDWLVKDEEKDFGDILTEILDGIDAIFYGRISYDLWGNFHPDEKASPKLKEAYKLLHSKTKYVFSKTKEEDDSEAIFINSDIKENILEIKQKVDGDIWLYGGGKLIASIVNLGLVDVYRLAVHPVIIGDGIPLFKDIKHRISLKLIDTEQSKSGVILLTYSTSDNENRKDSF